VRLLQLLDNVPIAQVTAENKRSLFLGPPALQAQRMKELVGWWTPELQCTAMPRQIRATIAQISDLHINRKVDPSVITMLKHLLQKITPSPDILIVSGDLANQPVPWQMKKAAELVHDIEKLCKPKCTIVIPGNHDFKFWGNVGLRRLTRIPFEIYFRRNGLERTFFWRVKQAFKLGLNALCGRDGICVSQYLCICSLGHQQGGMGSLPTIQNCRNSESQFLQSTPIRLER